jgi:hypothetical protein
MTLQSYVSVPCYNNDGSIYYIRLNLDSALQYAKANPDLNTLQQKMQNIKINCDRNFC